MSTGSMSGRDRSSGTLCCGEGHRVALGAVGRARRLRGALYCLPAWECCQDEPRA